MAPLEILVKIKGQVNKDRSLRHDILLCKQQTSFLVPYDGQISADAKCSLDKMDAPSDDLDRMWKVHADNKHLNTKEYVNWVRTLEFKAFVWYLQ